MATSKLKLKKIKNTEPINFKVSKEVYDMVIEISNHDGGGNLSLALRKLIERRYFELSQSAL